MVLLSNDQFLTTLQSLYTSPSGSVYVTMKRYAYQSPKSKAKAEAQDVANTNKSSSETTYGVLFRAHTSKTKISTLVAPGSSTSAFLSQYTTITRLGMSNLKKKDRKKKQKKATDV